MKKSNEMNFAISDSAVLQYAVENGILKTGDVREEMIKKQKQTYLKMHEEKHKIWYDENSNQWMTYFDDSNSKRGIILKRRKEKTDLENLIIEHYRELENIYYLKDIFYLWADSKLKYREIKPQTYTRYENEFLRFFTPEYDITRKPIADITDLDLEDFIKTAIGDHELTTKKYNGLTLLLNGIFKYAKKHKLTTFNILDFFEHLELSSTIFSPTVEKPDELEVYNEQEIQLLKKYCLSKDSLHYLGFFLVFVCGLRVGELSTLKPADLFLDDHIILVSRTEIHYNKKSNNNKKKNVVEVQEMVKTKSGNREVYINDLAISILKRILELNPNPKEFLFEINGERIKNKGFNRALERACKSVNIPFRSMHKIRRTYGTTLIDNGVNDALTAKQMGHSDISTTKKYYYRQNKTKEHNKKEIKKALSGI